MNRPFRPTRLRCLCAALVLAFTFHTSIASARPPGGLVGGRGGPCGPPHADAGTGRLEGLVEQLGLDETTLAAVDAEIDASRVHGRELRRQLRSAHDEMRSLLEAEAPDEDAIYAQVDVITAYEAAAQKNRLGTLFRVRALLPPDARERLIGLMKHHRSRHRGRHARPSPPGELE